MTATVTVDNITVYGPARVFIAAKSEPAPLNSIAYGTTWGGNWVDLGSTTDGSAVQFQHTIEAKQIKVDQYTSGVKSIRQSDTCELTLPLAEATLQSMKYAIGLGTYTAGATESTLKVGAIGGQVTPLAIGIEVLGTGASDSATTRYRRYICWACVPTDGMTRESGRDGSPLEMKFQLLADTSQAAGEELYKVINRQVA